MFVTVEQVLALTGKEVTQEIVNLAQTMLEIYVGRVDEDIVDASDRSLMANATAMQAVYMMDNPESILDQAAVTQNMESDTMVTFDTAKFSPFLSPWAFRACDKLSWNRSRSLHTGPVFGVRPLGWAHRWVTE